MPKLLPYLPYNYILDTITHAKPSNDPKSLAISVVIVFLTLFISLRVVVETQEIGIF